MKSKLNWLTSKIQRSDDGQGLAEYGLILSLIALVCIVALTTLGTSISGLFNQVAGSL
jgi:pilus assembly protein Flp/PilA